MTKPWEDEEAVVWSEAGATSETDVASPLPPETRKAPAPAQHRRYLDGRVVTNRRTLLWAYIEVFAIGIIFGLLIAWGIQLAR